MSLDGQSEVDSGEVFSFSPGIANISYNVTSWDQDDARSIYSSMGKGSKKKTKTRKKEKPREEPETSSGILGLFRYSDKWDIILMIVGTISSVINGTSLPVMAMVFGRMTSMFIQVAKEGFAPSVPPISPPLKGILQHLNVTYDEIYSAVNSTASGNNSGITREQFTESMTYFSMYYVYISMVVFTAVFIQTLCWETSCERQVYRLRHVFFSQILRQDVAWYDENEDGDLTHKLSDDLERVREGIGCKFSFLTQYLSTFVTGIVVGFNANVKLTTALLILAPFIIGLSAIVARAMSGSAIREQLRYGVAGGIAQEVLSAIKTVASFGGERREINRYEKALDEGRRVTMGKYYILSVAAGLIFTVTYGAFAAAFWYGSHLVGTEQATPGQIFTVFFSVMAGAFTVGNALPFVNTVSTAIGSASTIFGIIDRIPPIDPYSQSGEVLDKVIGRIELKHVHFSYPTRPSIKVLQGLSIDILPGKSVALVGSSGAGKSTLVGLLLRFYSPEKGEILLDGRPITDLNLHWLRSQIGLVSQEPVLFGVSIAENIRYGRDNVSMDEIIQAATLANAHNFIKELPNGYDTHVGDRGTMMSGGQKQRIAIARALVRNPKILLLDEATSALDAQSEGVVQAALENAMKGRTTIIIAHRLSTIRNVDVIYALKDGKVHESGSHDELMKKEGIYYNLVLAQKRQENKEQLKEESDEEIELLDLKPEDQDQPRRKSSGFFSRALSKRRKSSAVAPKPVNQEEQIKQELAKKVSFFKILKMNHTQWHNMILTLVGCIIVGTSMPLFASFYADVFHTFTLTGEDFQNAVLFWTGVYICFALTTGFSNFLVAICSSIATEKLIAVMRLSAFTNILRQAINWFDNEAHTPGRLITCLARDPPLIKSAAGFRAGQVVIALTTLVASVVIAFISGWKLALLLLTVAPIISGAAYKQASIFRRNQKRDAKFMDDAGQVATEGIQNLKTVQSLGKEKLFLQRYSDCLKLPYKEARKQAYVYAVVYAIAQSVIYIMYAVAFRFGSYLISLGEMDPTAVYRVFFALSFCATAIGQSSAYFQEFYKAKLSIGFVYQLMSLQSSIDVLSDDGFKPEIKGRVVLRDVHFAYPTRKHIPILRGLNLTIEPGQTVALVGGSGCGKSTVIGLLERFYSPDSGQVLLDGVDVSKYNLHYLRSHFGLVTQEPTLFDCSIKDNIAYGARDPSKVTFDDIEHAAKTANIHEFIVNLPQGYDTPVGDRGAKLSGGQKQRIAIARALIRNPKILLLDEATSALDTESEKIVQEALDKARKGRTSIVIAHRLSTIQNADLIFVIQKGQVIEKGTHDELKAQNGFYFELIKHQS